jgi:hypothetical protein
MGTVEFSIDENTAIEMHDRAVFFLLPLGGAFIGLFVVLPNLPGADDIYILGIHSNTLFSFLCGESSYLLKPARMAT